MQVNVGMIIGFNLLNSEIFEVEIDDARHNVHKFTIKQYLKNINDYKLGNFVVVYKNEGENDFRIKLISELI